MDRPYLVAIDDTDSTGTVTGMFHRLATGDEAAARGLWEHYCPRLTAMALKVFRHRSDRFPEAEDAVVSAFASFCKAAQDGQIDGDVDRHQLWRLLKRFTIRKVSRQIERDDAAKRGAGQVVTEADLPGGSSDAANLDRLFGAVPTPQFDMACEDLLAQLPDDELRMIAVAKLMGYTNNELSLRIGCTERRIERKLHRIRLTWKNEFPEK